MNSKIVFLSYINRSGSTFLANAISRHDGVCVCPEAGSLLENLHLKGSGSPAGYVRRCQSDPKLASWGLSASAFASAAKSRDNVDAMLSLLAAYRRQTKPDAAITIFKGGPALECINSFLQAPDIEVQLLAAVRDGRASYASQTTSLSSSTRMPMQVCPVAAAKHWARFVRSVQAAMQQRTLPVTLVRYEDMIRDYPSELRRVLSSLGVGEAGPKAASSAARTAELAERIPDAQRHLHKNITKAPDASRIDAWKSVLTASQVALFERHAQQELQALEYTLVASRVGGTKLFVAQAWYGMNRLRCHVGGRVLKACA